MRLVAKTYGDSGSLFPAVRKIPFAYFMSENFGTSPGSESSSIRSHFSMTEFDTSKKLCIKTVFIYKFGSNIKAGIKSGNF